MKRMVALGWGVAAWAAVAAVASLLVFNMGDKNQVLMFLPILAVVIAAWAVGEAVTERVFGGQEEERV